MPQAATTERLRSRKFNKRPPQWRRLQLTEPTGKAESEAAALPIVPGASRQEGARGLGAARAALARPLPGLTERAWCLHTVLPTRDQVSGRAGGAWGRPQAGEKRRAGEGSKAALHRREDRATRDRN